MRPISRVVKGSTRQRNEPRCEDLLTRSELLDTHDLDWDNAGRCAPESETVAALVYMRDVEAFTNRYLTGLVAHPATLGDSLVARFLPIWQREEMEHARALDKYLVLVAARHGIDVPAAQAPPPPSEERWQVLLTRPIGHVVTAAHMTWGAANELLTMTGYRLLAAKSADPVLRELLRRIAAQESRHYSFYRLQAEFRLEESRLARFALAKIMQRAWTPVGVGDGFKSPMEFDRLLTYLAGDEAGDDAIRKMDGVFTRLPGLGDTRIYAAAAATTAARRKADSNRGVTPRRPTKSATRHRASRSAGTRTVRLRKPPQPRRQSEFIPTTEAQ